MLELSLLVSLIGLGVFYAAWYEHRRDNPRDAGLLAAIGVGTLAMALGNAAM